MDWNKLQEEITFTYNEREITFSSFQDVWCFFSRDKPTGHWNNLLGRVTKEQLARWNKEEFEESLRDTFEGEVDDTIINTFVQKWQSKPIVKVNAQANGRTNGQKDEYTLRLRL